MKIAVDIDDTLTPTMSALLKFYNKYYNQGEPISFEEVQNYDHIWHHAGWTAHEFVRFLNAFDKSRYQSSLTPFDTSESVISNLHTDHSILAITNRSINIIRRTLGWMDRYFGVGEVYFARDQFPGRTKGDICQEKGIDVLIDDVGKTCLDARNKVGIVLLMDAPWNREVRIGGNLHRVKNWKEINTILK